MSTNCKLLLFTLLVFLPWRVWGQNPNYHFSLVAINGQTIDGIRLSSGFIMTPCINDVGEIVFGANYELATGNFGTAIFTLHHLIVKTGDMIDGEMVTNVFQCSLNNSGSLLFLGELQSGRIALFQKDRGFRARRLAVEGERIDGLEIQSFFTFWINDLGQTVFSASYKCANHTLKTGIFSPKSVLLTPGSTVDHYVLSSIDPLFAFSSRHLFFHAYNANIGEGIFSLHQLLLKAGDTVSGFTFIPVGSSAFGYLAASENGRLAFGATYDNGSGIFTPHAIVASTPGLLPTPSAINNSGSVIYGEPSGLVVNQTPLLSFGDSIDGHILNGLSFPPAINDWGAVVFTGNFGPDAGVVLAQPNK